MNQSRINNGETFSNPFLWADVPDPDVIRVGDAYYMTSTTMYFSPGCPVMKSKDLVNWKIVNYVYDILDDSDIFTFRNGKNSYGRGSWASSLRYYNGTYYVTFTALNTGKTYMFQTEDIENGQWRRYTFDGVYHDMSLLFDDDGRVYMVYGGGTIKVIELTSDASAIKPDGLNKVIIEKANAGGDGGLNAEGSHICKLNGKYYIFMIAWPPAGSGRRIELCYRADRIDGHYEGRVILDDDIGFNNAGVAQGGIIDTAGGDWYAMLFQDHGSVGRVPVLVPVRWENDWPVFGINGRVPKEMTVPVQGYSTESIIISDEFNQRDIIKNYTAVNDSSYKNNNIQGENDYNGSNLALEWQWNHNPDNNHWSLTERPGFLRLTTCNISHDITAARNTLTQRTFGPECSGTVAIDVQNMKDGDKAGLAALQDYYGLVGVKMLNNEKFIVMVNADSGKEEEIESVPLTQDTIYLKIDFMYYDAIDKAYFYYSTDGENWTLMGNVLQMSYRLSHFVGYRFALFNYAAKGLGGYVDFDYFRVSAEMVQNSGSYGIIGGP